MTSELRMDHHEPTKDQLAVITSELESILESLDMAEFHLAATYVAQAIESLQLMVDKMDS